MSSLENRPNELEIQFEMLSLKWRNETGHLSSTTAIREDENCQQLIKLGTAILPLIFKEYQKGKGHWNLVLTGITGETLAGKFEPGRYESLRSAWFEWGKENGYIT